MLGSILKGRLKMSPSPSFLLCVVLYSLPKLRPDGGKQHKQVWHFSSSNPDFFLSFFFFQLVVTIYLTWDSWDSKAHL